MNENLRCEKSRERAMPDSSRAHWNHEAEARVGSPSGLSSSAGEAKAKTAYSPQPPQQLSPRGTENHELRTAPRLTFSPLIGLTSREHSRSRSRNNIISKARIDFEG